MRELERDLPPASARIKVAIVGAGRLGRALAAALRDAGYPIEGPLGRDAAPGEVDAVVLCVPDQEIAAAAAGLPRGPSAPLPLVGHCSGATGLEPLAPHEAFSLHPLMTVTAQGASFAGAGAAIAGTSARALAVARELAVALGMRAVEISESDRVAYHAAASMASNFLVTLEAAADRLAATAGVDRELLVPLVRATVENWAALGPERALTGPVARGDEETVARQRAELAARTPELLELFDALANATRALARREEPSFARREPTGKPRRGARMRTLRTVAELREALTPARRAGRTIGLVPTMGSFHEGHLSLIRRAREQCDELVVSLFVNPTQFDQQADLRRYPRDEAGDALLAAQAGVDYLFAPPVEEIYPVGFATTVSVSGISETLEGAHRGRAHFDAVATVVTKLFNIVGPDVAYFGQKDAQQALVIKRLVRDLDIPIRIEVCPTMREPDGLAMSSRNALLSPEERARAVAISRALRRAQEAVAGGERDSARVAGAARAEMASEGIEPEYLELVSTDTLAPVSVIDAEVLAVVAAQVGAARLIDNQIMTTNGRP